MCVCARVRAYSLSSIVKVWGGSKYCLAYQYYAVQFSFNSTSFFFFFFFFVFDVCHNCDPESD